MNSQRKAIQRKAVINKKQKQKKKTKNEKRKTKNIFGDDQRVGFGEKRYEVSP